MMMLLSMLLLPLLYRNPPNSPRLVRNKSHVIQLGQQLGRRLDSERILDVEGEEAFEEVVSLRREFAVFGVMLPLLDAELAQHFDLLQVFVRFPRNKVDFFQELPLVMLQLPHDGVGSSSSSS